MVVAIFFNGMLKGIENISLGSRAFIFLHSKIKCFPGIPNLVEKKVGVFKNKDTSFDVLGIERKKEISLTSSMHN